MNRRTMVCLSVVVVAVATAGWFAYCDTTPHSQTQNTSQVSRKLSAVQWQSRLVRRGVRELRDSHVRAPLASMLGPAKVMPLKMRRKLRRTLGGARDLHLRFNSGHHITTSVGIGLWVVEGEGVTCLALEVRAASTCDTSTAAERRGLLLEVYRSGRSSNQHPSHFLALGVAPNWASGVRLMVGDRPRTLITQNQIYALRAEVPIQVVGMTKVTKSLSTVLPESPPLIAVGGRGES
jgi:hypothetical protein